MKIELPGDDQWVTYPSLFSPCWVRRLWRRMCCPHGWHLLDMWWSAEDVGVFCDACGLAIVAESIEREGDEC